MRVGGIIAEYNPFHNGHSYQIETFKQEYNITHLVVVMSGNYVQRGDVAIVDKFQRSKMAIQGGADLILELPVVYALSTAERFALGGVYILNSIGCVEYLSFGSTENIDTLLEISQIVETVRNCKEVLTLLEDGITFPVAVSKVINKLYGDSYSRVLDDPNNVLGLEYIHALRNLESEIIPTTLTRKAVQHNDTTPNGNLASASYIRSLILEGKSFSEYVPKYTRDSINEISKLENLERVILYKLRNSTISEIQSLFDVSQGLEYRILQAVKKSTTLEELFSNIKTKRYTLARIRRIILNLTLGISQNDISIMPPYARVLAMNRKGIDILSKAKKTATIPMGTSLAKLEKISPDAKRFAQLESLSTDIYNLSQSSILPCGLDYTHKLEISE